MKSTTHANAQTVDPRWLHLDAQNQVLGRLAVRVATILMGKHKPTWTPHVDCGDFVIVTNAAGIRLTGRKAEQKVYRYHTGYVGGLVERPYVSVKEQTPETVVELAVRRMMPKTKLGRRMFKKLKVYAGAQHPHDAQKPETITL